MADPITFTVATWRKIAEHLEKGQVRFSTGSQCRMADGLAEFIRFDVARKHGTTQHTIDFGENWDAVLSVRQANY